jgi:hypothetical protein
MANAKSTSSYHLGKTVHIGGEGGWDYLTADDDARRLNVTPSSKAHVLNADTLARRGCVCPFSTKEEWTSQNPAKHSEGNKWPTTRVHKRHLL